MSYEFGGYRLDPSSRRLTAPDGREVALKGRAYDTLLYLVRHAGVLQSKDDLLTAIWPGLVVEENNLNQAISAVRRALGDVTRPRRFVITVPGQGYQLVAAVQVQTGGPADPALPPSPARLPAALVIILVVVIGSGLMLTFAGGNRGGVPATDSASLAVVSEPAGSIAGSIVPPVEVPSDRTRRVDPEAYRHYLIGRELLRKRLRLDESVEHLGRAVLIDPGFAEALAELAIGLTISAPASQASVASVFERARQAIDAAIAVDPKLARAHAARGLLLQMQTPRDLEASERALRRAIRIEPDQVDTLNWLGNVLIAQHRYHEGAAVWGRAGALDPLAPAVNRNLAALHAWQGNFAEAERRYRRLLELPSPPPAHVDLTKLYAGTGRLADSVQAAKDAVLATISVPGRPPSRMNFLALAYARLGIWDQSHYWLDRQERAWASRYWVPFLAAPALRREGRYRAMVKRYQRVLAAEKLQMADLAPEDLAEYGGMLAMAGDHPGAITILGGSIAEWITRQYETSDDILQTLAWAHLQTGGDAQAAAILARIDDDYLRMQAQGFLHLSTDRLIFAQNALLRGNTELAIARLEQAFDAGWRDFYAVVNDPRWQGSLAHPRLAKLLERVKADLDAERAEVLRIDATHDFVKQLDQLILATNGRG